jgi:hypothetical protein
MFPSVRTIETRLRIPRETARLIRKLLDGRADPLQVSPKTEAWFRSCYSQPSTNAQILHAVDCVLETCGVESFTLPSNGYRCHARYQGHYTYANTGDTYAATIVRDHARRRWLVCSWGDLVERESEMA